jgi:hypothetical protein
VKLKLTIESIPACNWHISLANMLPREVWDTLRREVYFKARYICEVCAATDVEVHAHERWQYDDRKRTQKLVGIQCICKDCHDIRHWGRAVNMVHEGKYPGDTLQRLTAHFLEVNKCTLLDFEKHKVQIGQLTHMRSKKEYKVDFGKFKLDRIIDLWEQENPKKRL